MKCADQTHEQAVLTLSRDLWHRREREQNDTPGTCRLCGADLPEDPYARAMGFPITVCERSALLYDDARARIRQWRAEIDRDRRQERKSPIPKARGGW